MEKSTANPSMSKSGTSVATCGHVCVDTFGTEWAVATCGHVCVDTFGTEWEPGWCVEEEDDDEDEEKDEKEEEEGEGGEGEEEKGVEEAAKEEEKAAKEAAAEEEEAWTLGMIPAAPSCESVKMLMAGPRVITAMTARFTAVKNICTEACSAASTTERGITNTPNMPMYMAHCASQVVAMSAVVHSKKGTRSVKLPTKTFAYLPCSGVYRGVYRVYIGCLEAC